MAFQLFPDVIHYNTYNILIYNKYRIITSTNTTTKMYGCSGTIDISVSKYVINPFHIN